MASALPLEGRPGRSRQLGGLVSAVCSAEPVLLLVPLLGMPSRESFLFLIFLGLGSMASLPGDPVPASTMSPCLFHPIT